MKEKDKRDDGENNQEKQQQQPPPPKKETVGWGGIKFDVGTKGWGR